MRGRTRHHRRGSNISICALISRVSFPIVVATASTSGFGIIGEARHTRISRSWIVRRLVVAVWIMFHIRLVCVCKDYKIFTVSGETT